MSSSSNRAARAPRPLRSLPSVPQRARLRMISLAAGVAISLGATAHAEIDVEVQRETGTPALSNAPVALSTPAASVNIAAVGLNAAAVGIAEKDKPTRIKPQPASSLRCWQYGRLIFEENNLEPSPQSLDKSLAWKLGDHHTPSLHLLQLHDTVCLFKANEGGVRSQ